MAAWVIPAIAAAGSAAGGIGSLIQGMRSGRGGADIGAQHYHNVMYQYEAPIYRMRGLMKAAKTHGIHPLAMLGQSFSSPTYRSGSTEKDYGAIGRGLSAIGNAPAKYVRVKSGLELDRMRLENAKLELEIMQNAGQGVVTDNLGVVDPGNPSRLVTGAENALYQRQSVPTSSAPGIQEGVVPEERFAVDQYGWVKEALSEPIQEAAESDWYFQIQRVLTKGIRHGWVWWSGTGTQGKSFRRLISHVERRKALLPRLPVGMEYRFSIVRNMFQRVPIGKRPRFFTNTTAELAYRNIKRRSRRERERRFK